MLRGPEKEAQSFTDELIIRILTELETGIRVSELCRKHGASNINIYKWIIRFGGMDVSDGGCHVKRFAVACVPGWS
ncbi:transposase [Bacillus subtilis]|nr:transposase [Pseudochrobactrum asaccharolyticum]MCF7673625.1 transposase [Bacillus subtilis]